MQWFHVTEGHMEVPGKFVLDEVQCREAGLPEHVTEFRLGRTVDNIRARSSFVKSEEPSRQAQYAANKKTLDSSNFIWDHKQHRFDFYIKPAVSWFKASEGHMEVPARLVLDEAQCCNAGLPEHVKEFRLGGTVNNTRAAATLCKHRTRGAKLDTQQTRIGSKLKASSSSKNSASACCRCNPRQME